MACRYTNLVNKGMEKAELIVKVVMAPHEQAEEFISSYRKLMQEDNDVNNFQKILEMKVISLYLWGIIIGGAPSFRVSGGLGKG